MGKAICNIIFRLCPTKGQEETLTHWLDLHWELYNAALLERRDAYRKCGVSLTYNQQQNELPAVKEARPDLVPLDSHALQETVRRVDRAYKFFFRRVKTGEKPGFSQFKGRGRFDSFTYPNPARWKIIGQEGHKGWLSITNLGQIRMRGQPRVVLSLCEPRTPTVKHHNGRRYAVITVPPAFGGYCLPAFVYCCGRSQAGQHDPFGPRDFGEAVSKRRAEGRPQPVIIGCKHGAVVLDAGLQGGGSLGGWKRT